MAESVTARLGLEVERVREVVLHCEEAAQRQESIAACRDAPEGSRTDQADIAAVEQVVVAVVDRTVAQETDDSLSGETRQREDRSARR